MAAEYEFHFVSESHTGDSPLFASPSESPEEDTDHEEPKKKGKTSDPREYKLNRPGRRPLGDSGDKWKHHAPAAE